MNTKQGSKTFKSGGLYEKQARVSFEMWILSTKFHGITVQKKAVTISFPNL